ncbi:MAG: tail fiber domain-containing protein [Ignavibacteria bacterium]|nr:tail fiber domain-containing protein [Ignavibacteria bacterium]
MKTNLNLSAKLVIIFLMFATSVFSQPFFGINPGALKKGLIIGMPPVNSINGPATPFLKIESVFSNTLYPGQVRVYNSLRIENTTSSNIGAIYKGTDRFLHNYGTNNTFLGINSGNFIITGNSNTAMGPFSLSSVTVGSFNTAIGVSSLGANTSGQFNSALGHQSLQNNTSGQFNTALGYQSLRYNTTGYGNTAVGRALLLNTSGFENTANGDWALRNNNGNYNVAMGNESLRDNISGYYNTAIGYRSLLINTSGSENTSMGSESLLNNISGSQNTTVGYISLYNITTGNSNTALGDSAGYGITTGSNNTAIGKGAQVPNGTLSNQVRIGNTAVTLYCTQVPWNCTSDRRLKSNILTSNLGLNFISKLRTVSYTRNSDEKHKTEFGFIAQEVEDVLKEFGEDNSGIINIDDEGMYSMRYNDLFAPIVKAIQELKTENEELKQNNIKLASEIESIKSMNEKLVKLEKMVNELDNFKQTSHKGNKVNLTNLK